MHALEIVPRPLEEEKEEEGPLPVWFAPLLFQVQQGPTERTSVGGRCVELGTQALSVPVWPALEGSCLW